MADGSGLVRDSAEPPRIMNRGRGFPTSMRPGVGELVCAFKSTSAAGGVPQIAHASRGVRQLLNIPGVLKLLTAAEA